MKQRKTQTLNYYICFLLPPCLLTGPFSARLAEKEHEELGGRRAGGHALPGHDRLHIHRGQRRLPEVLLQVASPPPRPANLGLRRRRVHNDLQAENGLWLRVHVQAAAHVPRRRREQGPERSLQKAHGN
jgi:hypothetical protein